VSSSRLSANGHDDSISDNIGLRPGGRFAVSLYS
jgi:hypothetical protein